MASLTNYAEDQQIARMFRGDTTPFPGTWHVALFSAASGESGGGTEFSGGSYARVAVANASGSWAATSGGNGTTSNVNEVLFVGLPAATATHWGLFDAASAGNLWVYAPLSTSRTFVAGDSARFAPGTLTYQADN